MKPSEKVYMKYDYLAKKYASKIFSYEVLSFEYEDLVQEFRIKIFTSIKAYGRRYDKFMRGDASRPVPIKYYLESACRNKANDFIKFISREGNKVRIDDINYDFGVEEDTFADSSANRFFVNGIDLLEGLVGKERSIFSLFLRGYKINFLRKVYSNKAKKNGCSVEDVIESQKTYLIETYGSELLEKKNIYYTYSLDDED